MFTFKPPDESGLQGVIDKHIEEMKDEPVTSDDYPKMVKHLTELYSLKYKPQRISPDTAALVIGNIVGILLIVGHERAHVITTRAKDFILRLK